MDSIKDITNKNNEHGFSFKKYEKFTSMNLPEQLDFPVELRSSNNHIKTFLSANYYRHKKNDFFQFIRAFTFTFQYIVIILLIFFIWKDLDPIKILVEKINGNYLSLISSIFGIFGSVMTLYWNFKNTYASQWKYLADLYNKIFITDLASTDKFVLLYQKTTLALDVVTMDFWRHESYSKLFAFILEISVIHCCENYKNQKIGNVRVNDPNLIFYLINSKQLDSNTASSIIAKLQNDLELDLMKKNTKGPIIFEKSA